jgi:hypothetical protein
LQALYPADRLEPAVPEICALFPEELIPHLEFVRFGGRVTASGLPLIRYTTAERLNEIIAMHEARGVLIADPHVFTLEDGTRHKRADADQLGFKRRVDPHGLLNPGKMRSFVVIARNAAFTHKGKAVTIDHCDFEDRLSFVFDVIGARTVPAVSIASTNGLAG